MAKEIQVHKILEEAGYKPLKDRAIVVTYAPTDLSDKLAKFFVNEFFVLQICEDQLVILPFSQLSWRLKKEVALEIPKDAIQSIEISAEALNEIITIQLADDKIVLSTQQKALSDMRSSGILASENIFSGKNWHKENLMATLKDLKSYKN